MPEFLVLALIGVVVGISGGLLGIGGSIVMIPAVTEYLGPDQHRYQAAAMIVNFFVAAPAVLQHRRAKAVDAGIVARLVPGAMVGVICGVCLSETSLFSGASEPWLRLLFGVFVLLSAVVGMYRLAKPGPADAELETGRKPRPAPPWAAALAVAVPTGLVAGLLGVGGGIVAVPLQRRLMSVPIRESIANSAAMLAATSLVGAFVKNAAYLAEKDGSLNAITLAAIVVPTAVLGSLIGSHVMYRLPLQALRATFIVLLLVAAARFISGAARDLAI
jgi:uncharacterized membrane protein YfcA